MIELIERTKLRDSLLYEQAKYMMSEHEQNKHTSAGFLLAVAELDSQPKVEAIPVEWLREYGSRMLDFGESIERLIKKWERECGNK